jgi:hypothetical protein
MTRYDGIELSVGQATSNKLFLIKSDLKCISFNFSKKTLKMLALVAHIIKSKKRHIQSVYHLVVHMTQNIIIIQFNRLVIQ